MSEATPSPAPQSLSRRDIRITLGGLGLAMFVSSLDQTIVATALPRIAKDLGGFASYAGVVTAYMVAATAVMPIVGKLSDLYGRKPFLVGGMLWFTLASVLCGFSHSMGQLIAFRALQGLGSGTMMCAASTALADLFSPAERGKVIGVLVPIASLSSVLGPLVGGWLTDGPGWPYIFFVNLPIGLLGTGVLARFAPHIRPAKVEDFRIDYAGVAALIASVVPLLWALNSIGPAQPWSSPKVVGPGLLGLLMGGVFLAVERRAAHPILPPQLFRYSIVVIVQFSAALISAAMYGVTFFVPLYAQGVLGADASTSGAILLAFTFTFAAMVALTGQLISRLGHYKIFALLGPLIAAVGAVLLARLGPLSGKGALEADILVMGLGLAACMPVYNLASQNAVPLHLLGSATSMINFMRSIGSSLGVAVFGSILNARAPQAGLAPALQTIFTVLPGLFLVVLAMALFLEDKPLRRTNAVETKVVEELE